MGFLAPAMPWIIQGGSALLGGMLGKKSEANAAKRSPEEQAGLSGETGAATNLANTGTALTSMGMPAVQGATNYWSTLLRGNRAAQSQATAGPRAQLTDLYRGAKGNLERAGIRGASKDRATEELGRDEASKVAGLTTGVQPMAAEQLGSLGSTTTGQGISATGGAGSLYSNLLGQGFQNRKYARGEGEKAGSSIGNLLGNLFGSLLGGKKSTPTYGGGGFGDQGPNL